MKKILSLLLSAIIAFSCFTIPMQFNASSSITWAEVKPESAQILYTFLYKFKNKISDMFFGDELYPEEISISCTRKTFAQGQEIKKYLSIKIKPDISNYKYAQTVNTDSIISIYKITNSKTILTNKTNLTLTKKISSNASSITISEPGDYVLIAQPENESKLKDYIQFKIVENDIIYQKGDSELLAGTYCDYTDGRSYKTTKVAKYYATPMIKVSEGDRFTCCYVHSIVMFDSDQKYITGLSNKNFPEYTGNIRANDFVIPEGTSYIKVNFDSSYDSYALCKISKTPYQLVVLGDSIFGMNEKPNDIPSAIEYQTGIKTANCAIGGSTAANNTGAYKLLEFNPIVDAICNNDFVEIEAAAKAALSTGTANNRVVHNAQTLKTIDFSKVKTVLIAYGTNDWNFGVSLQTYKDSLTSGINKLKEKYPQLQIVLCTPIYRQVADKPNSNNVYLSEFAIGTQEVASETNCICLNNYDNSGINGDNYAEYLKDGTHPNATGVTLLADLISNELLTLTN